MDTDTPELLPQLGIYADKDFFFKVLYKQWAYILLPVQNSNKKFNFFFFTAFLTQSSSRSVTIPEKGFKDMKFVAAGCVLMESN